MTHDQAAIQGYAADGADPKCTMIINSFQFILLGPFPTDTPLQDSRNAVS